MIHTKAAKRYAAALLELAEQNNILSEVLSDITLMQSTLDGSRELVLFLKSPIIKRAKKLAVLDEIFFKNVTELTAKFVEILVRKNREQVIQAICTAFVELYDKHVGNVRVSVTSAYPLSKTDQKSLEKAINTLTGSNPILKVETDKNLVGGMMFQIKDTIYDGSVKHKLEQLTESLATSVV